MVSVLKQINNGEWGNFNAWTGTPHRVAGNNAAPVPKGCWVVCAQEPTGLMSLAAAGRLLKVRLAQVSIPGNQSFCSQLDSSQLLGVGGKGVG